MRRFSFFLRSNVKRLIFSLQLRIARWRPWYMSSGVTLPMASCTTPARRTGKFPSVHCATAQVELDGSLPDFTSFDIQDDGIGFTDEHRDSFDTLYTDRRIAEFEAYLDGFSPNVQERDREAQRLGSSSQPTAEERIATRPGEV